MMLKNMRAVDFNLWMTLIAMTKGRLVDEEVKQFLTIPPKNVLPEYPRDLTKFVKPSIIIQKVADDIVNNGFIGQAYDSESNTYYDVNAKTHDMQYQFDVFADTNTQCSLMTSLVCDDIFTSTNIEILDFVSDMDNPQPMGYAKLHNEFDVIPMNPTENYDYRTAVRFYLTVVQTVVPKQEFVDLSKWIKISQRVII